MRFLTCLVYLLLPVVGIAQVTQRNLLQKKYPAAVLKQYLLKQSVFRPFPKNAGEWKKILPDSLLQQIVKTGESVINESFPNIPATVTLDYVRNGNRTRYENLMFGKRYRLWYLVMAESVEGKNRFTDSIINAIWSISEESFWGATAHLFLQKQGPGLPDVEDPVVDLFAAETAAFLAWADYFIGPKLDSVSLLIRRRIYYEVNRRVFVPMQSAKYEWMGKGNINAKLNNWSPWIVSNYLTAVLLLEKNESRRLQFVSQAMQITDQYINGIGEDGSCEEGPQYWSFGAGCVLDILNLLSSAMNDRVGIYNEKIIRYMGAYIYRTHISENYFVNVADSHPELNPNSIMVWRFGKAVSDSNLSSFGASLFRRNGYSNAIFGIFHRTRILFNLCSLNAVASDESDFYAQKDVWMPQAELMTSRLQNGLFIAAHGGNNGESHNHNDVGDLIIYANGDPVIIDAGSGTYTSKTFSKDRYTLWFNTSAYHNLPAINGLQQAEGSAYAAKMVSYKKDNGQTILSMNLEKAYPAATGLKKWKRTFTAGAETITVSDHYEAVKPLFSLTQSFMTVCAVDITRPGIIIFKTSNGKNVFLKYDDSWNVSNETIPLLTEEESGFKTTWRNQPVTRILLTHISPGAAGSFKYIISMDEKKK